MDQLFTRLSVAEHCPCGRRRLHYPTSTIEGYMKDHVRAHGRTELVQTTEGTFSVPRHFLVLHGYRPSALKKLAALYGWRFVRGK